MKTRASVLEVMTRDPIFSVPDATVESIAKMMVEMKCGEIPICEEGQVVGVITDRDLACRVVALNRDASRTLARDVMTRLPVTVQERSSLTDAMILMRTEKLRRLPVVDRNGTLVGILSQVDVASRASAKRAGQLLAASEPTAQS